MEPTHSCVTYSTNTWIHATTSWWQDAETRLSAQIYIMPGSSKHLPSLAFLMHKIILSIYKEIFWQVHYECWHQWQGHWPNEPTLLKDSPWHEIHDNGSFEPRVFTGQLFLLPRQRDTRRPDVREQRWVEKESGYDVWGNLDLCLGKVGMFS